MEKNTKMITREEVAEHAGVSTATVSNVLNNVPKVGADVRLKVLRSIEQLGYIPNSSAHNLAFRRREVEHKIRTHNIGCIIYSGFNKFNQPENSDLMEEIDREIRRMKHHLYFYYRSTELSEDPMLFNKVVNRNNIDGLIVISSQLEGILEETKKRIKNIISIREPLGDDDKTDCVSFDEYGAVYNGVRHLVQLKHKRIVLVINPDSSEKRNMMRINGYKDACKSCGINYEESFIQRGCSSMKKSLDSAPTAVIISHIEYTSGILDAIKDFGLSVPDDISVIAIGNYKMLEELKPEITNMQLNTKDIAKITVNRLVEKINNPGMPVFKIVMPYELIERGSVRQVVSK